MATVEEAHAVYQAVYGRFIAEQHATCTRGAAEVKLQLANGTGAYGRLYCVDFIADDRLVEMSADSVARTPATLSIPPRRSPRRVVTPRAAHCGLPMRRATAR